MSSQCPNKQNHSRFGVAQIGNMAKNQKRGSVGVFKSIFLSQFWFPVPPNGSTRNIFRLEQNRSRTPKNDTPYPPPLLLG